MSLPNAGASSIAVEHAPRPEGRFRYVDGLRGAASLAVACYHITRYGPTAERAREAIPGFLQAVFDRGWIGVQVFFVISGFVIAYSVRNARVTPAYFANYALRRSLRLDPPYWTTIAFVVLLHFVLKFVFQSTSPLDVPEPMDPPLSPWVVVCHLLYIHKLQGFDSVSAGFWTLCIEFQFYLAYVLSLGVTQWLARQTRSIPQAVWQTLLIGGLGVGSLFFWNLDRRVDNFVIYFFCLFFLGISAWWALSRQVSQWVFWWFCLATGARLAFRGAFQGFDQSLELKAALLTGISIYVVGRSGRLTTALDWRWLQYLGRISYSLYLIHFPVSHIVTTAAESLWGASVSPLLSACVLAVALAASIGAAHLLYIGVEAPSVRLAARFRRPDH